MLTLTNAFTVNGFTVLRDDGAGNRFYVLPKPDLALDEAGKPLFSLIVYRHDETRLDDEALGEDVGGGILTFTAELGVPQSERDAIVGQIAAMHDLDVAQVRLLDVPFKSGRVKLAVAAETIAGGDGASADNEFLRSLLGSGSVSGLGNSRTAVMAKLTQAGANLFSQIERLRTLPINVDYEMVFEHRLYGITLHVWCHMQKTYEFAKTFGSHVEDDYWGDESRADVRSFREQLTRNEYAGVRVEQLSSEVTPETVTSLREFGQSMLDKKLAEVVEITMPTGDERGSVTLKDYASLASSSFNFRLTERMVLEREYPTSQNISNVFQRADLDELVTFVDLRTDFFSTLKVPVRVNCDFEKLPIDSVTVTVDFRRKSLDGAGFESVTKSFDFRDGARIDNFIAYANSLDQVAYDWQAVVHYEGATETFTFRRRGVRDTLLVVDVGALGILAVDAGLGLVDPRRYPKATIAFRYDSRALGRRVEAEYVLDAETPSVRWTPIIQEEVDERGYEYKVDWLDEDGNIVQGQWTRTSASALRLDGPTVSKLEINVAPSGDFKQNIAKILVALRYQDPTDEDYVVDEALTFTDESQVLPFTVALRDGEHRDYLYRYTIVYRDGTERRFPAPDSGEEWKKGEPGFIVVGEGYDLQVQVMPFLLTYPDHAKLVEVRLYHPSMQAPDAVVGSYVFHPQANTANTWRVRKKLREDATYDAEVIYRGTAGQVASKVYQGLRSPSFIVEPPVTPPAPPAPPVTPNP
jgi:hypothetical protein